jgi:hypothetical protein
VREEFTVMRSLGGFVLLAGIGVGLFVYFPAPVDRSTTLEEAKRALAEHPVESRSHYAPTPAAAQPGSRVSSFAPGITLASPRHTAVSPPAASAAKIETIANWQTTVSGAGSGSLEPTDPDSRYKLVVDIQQQLKRVGCYWGRVNGAWNNSTREAMREFTTRSNAALPVEKPDYLLLTLLKSHTGRSCGAPESTVAAAPQAEVLPWKAPEASQNQATRLFTPVPTSVVTTEPLPGRMSIGGPRDFAPTTQEPLVPGAPAQRGSVDTAAYDPSASAPAATAPTPPAVAPKPRPSKKSASSHRRPTPGTPRYNLMLSLGGVY